MSILEHMMGLYDEALEEMMDAEKYAKLMEHAEAAETKAMYRSLGKQELDHELVLERAADRLFVGVDKTDPVHLAWCHLKKHLHNWRHKIETRISD